MAMTDEEHSYYGDIETHFVERRGSPLFITPAEWALVAKWEEQGIPVHVVKEGIDRVFERPRAVVKLRKLGYCRQTVEAAFRRFREVTFGGRGEGDPDEDRFDASAHLSRLAEEIVGFAPEMSARVAELSKSQASLQAIEDALTQLDEELLDAAEETLAAAERDLLRDDAARTLASYRDRMPEKVYRSALKSAYRRRLRDRVQLPRLSLFDR